MNDLNLSVMIMEYNATLEMVAYLSIKDRKDSPLAWRKLTKATGVV